MFTLVIFISYGQSIVEKKVFYMLVSILNGIFEGRINVAIILENSHRFDEDPEYGACMKRLWKGDWTETDIDYINTREVGKMDCLYQILILTQISLMDVHSTNNAMLHLLVYSKHISAALISPGQYQRTSSDTYTHC